ncbi:MAG: alanine racemase C-terminal domain-containing protein, partial [Candidatus Paceibacteria bacterium]
LCPPYIHCANSAVSLVQTEEIPQALVRPGLSLFGIYPSEEIARKSQTNKHRLRSVLTLKTRIVSLKSVSKGTYVGYDCTYQTKRDSRIAVLPMGYADGFDRGLSNQGEVLVNGCRAPVVGRVSMNMTMIDVTDVTPRPHVEQEVTVIGTEGEESILPPDIAHLLETNPYEVMARLRESLPKYWK